MPLPAELLLPIITVLATLRSQVTNWLRSRTVPHPRDLTVGTPVEFDDLTSESNKQEVRQHDYYDRRKETLNAKQRKYAVAADKDQYTNEALETLFSQAVEAGKGLDSLFANHEQKSSKDEPKDAVVMDGDEEDNAKDTAEQTAEKQMLPREAEARELYELYEMPAKQPDNNDQISADSLDSRVRLPWRQWINYLRSTCKTFSFVLRNPFKRHAKTCKEKPKAGRAGRSGKTGCEERRGDAPRSRDEENTRKTKPKNSLFKLVAKFRKQQIPSGEQTNATTKDEDETKNVLAANNQEKVQSHPLITAASMYGPSAVPLLKCAWGHDDCEYIREKKRLLGCLPPLDHQVRQEPVQRIKPRSHGTKGPVRTPKKAQKGKRWAWFTSRSKKASLKSGMKISNRPVEGRVA